MLFKSHPSAPAHIAHLGLSEPQIEAHRFAYHENMDRHPTMTPEISHDIAGVMAQQHRSAPSKPQVPQQPMGDGGFSATRLPKMQGF